MEPSKRVKTMCAFITLISASSYGFQSSKTFFLPRSQSVDAARELMGWQREINQYDVDGRYWSLALAAEYQHSFNPCAISNYVLGGSSFVFSGSRVIGRRSTDILADYFGLPQDFVSTVYFKPVITNFIMDLDFYMGLPFWCDGLYFRIHAPMVHCKADVRLDECIEDPGTDFYPAGYMGPERVPTGDSSHSVELAMQGRHLNAKNISVPLTFGDMKTPLEYGKIFGREARTHISDVQLVLGWNFAQANWYHVGLNARASLPTGTRPCAEFLLEAVIGNGRHTELGIGFTGHVDVWESSLWSCSLYCDANITHLFSSQQIRSFDFKNNGPGSRYMLLQEIVDGSENLFLGVDGPAAPNQYFGHIFPAINETTLCTKISIPVQADIVFKCAFYRCGIEVDFGYNLWVRSAEKLECRAQFPSRYAFKGDAQLYGFSATDVPVALNATQHNATLHGGQGTGNFVLGREFANDNVDSPIVATTDSGILTQLNAADSADLGIAQLPVQTSNPAQLLSDDDIDPCSGLTPKSITHKLFAHLGNRWEECECVVPFLGVGIEVEVAGRANNSACVPLSYWALIFKGGLTY